MMLGHYEGKLSEGGKEEEYDKGIGEGDDECRHVVVYQSAFLLLLALVYLLARVGLKAVVAEAEEEDGTKYLEEKSVLGIVDEVHYETHAQTRDEGVDKVGGGCSQTCHEAIPASFVESTLYAEHSDGAHGSGA